VTATSGIPAHDEWSYLMPREKLIRAAEYTRMSDENQSAFSLDFQRKKIREHCATQDWYIADIHRFSDGKSAKYWRDRKGLQALLQAAKHGEFEYVVMYRLDRFSRNRDHQIIIREQLQYYGVKVITLDPEEHADDDSLSGRIIREIFYIFAELELKKITERCQDGLKERYEDGYIPVSRRPKYGYVWEDRIAVKDGKERVIPKAAYVLNPKIVYTGTDGTEWTEGDVVASIYTTVDSGGSLRSVAHSLTAQGIPTPDGKTNWSPQTILDILKWEGYTGTHHANMRKHTYIPGEGIKREFRPEEEWIDFEKDTIPPIIDREVFDRIQERLELNRQMSPRNNPEPYNSLARCGTAVCGHCGANLSIQRTRKDGTSYYYCRVAKKGYNECVGPVIAVNLLDAALWEEAMAVIRNPKKLEASLQKKYTVDPTTDEIESARQGIAKLLPQIQNLIETIAETPAGEGRRLLSLRVDELGKSKLVFEQEIDRLTRTREQWKKAQEKLVGFHAWCNRMRTKLEKATYQEKLDAVHHLGLQVKLYKHGIRPRMQFEFRPPDVVEGIASRSGRAF
jgi:site-specific DNA recombinase